MESGYFHQLSERLGDRSVGSRVDRDRWQLFTRNNSQLPENEITALASDVYGNLWIGTAIGFVVKLSGTNWTLFQFKAKEK